MQSYRKRFKGHEEEIRQDVRTYGIFRAQYLWQSKDFLAWDNYVKDLMGDEGYSITTEVSECTFDSICENIVAKLYNKIVAIEAENQTLREQLKEAEEARQRIDERNRLRAVQLKNMLELDA